MNIKHVQIHVQWTFTKHVFPCCTVHFYIYFLIWVPKQSGGIDDASLIYKWENFGREMKNDLLTVTQLMSPEQGYEHCPFDWQTWALCLASHMVWLVKIFWLTHDFPGLHKGAKGSPEINWHAFPFGLGRIPFVYYHCVHPYQMPVFAFICSNL